MGAWASTFWEPATEPDQFHTLDGRTVEVPMMNQTARFPYAAGNGWQALSLPYDGRALELLMLMPAAGQFRDFARELDAQRIDSMLRAQQQRRIILSFPKFSLRTALLEEPEPIVVRIDRSFVFVLRHRASGVPLFVGHLLVP
jgi:serpin B